MDPQMIAERTAMIITEDGETWTRASIAVLRDVDKYWEFLFVLINKFKTLQNLLEGYETIIKNDFIGVNEAITSTYWEVLGQCHSFQLYRVSVTDVSIV